MNAPEAEATGKETIPNAMINAEASVGPFDRTIEKVKLCVLETAMLIYIHTAKSSMPDEKREGVTAPIEAPLEGVLEENLLALVLAPAL